jgi:hypothetical protein
MGTVSSHLFHDSEARLFDGHADREPQVAVALEAFDRAEDGL